MAGRFAATHYSSQARRRTLFNQGPFLGIDYGPFLCYNCNKRLVRQ